MIVSAVEGGMCKTQAARHFIVSLSSVKRYTTELSSMTLEGMEPSLTIEGATASVVFEACVEQVLAPTLRRGQMVVLNYRSAHKGEDKRANRRPESRTAGRGVGIPSLDRLPRSPSLVGGEVVHHYHVPRRE